jgi:F0F1-type ATP synthase delta subunit
MRGGRIARRYARALLAVGHEIGSSRAFLDEIDTLTQEVTGSDPLRRVLFAPVHPRAERKAVLRDVFPPCAMHCRSWSNGRRGRWWPR